MRLLAKPFLNNKHKISKVPQVERQRVWEGTKIRESPQCLRWGVTVIGYFEAAVNKCVYHALINLT